MPSISWFLKNRFAEKEQLKRWNHHLALVTRMLAKGELS
jgi:hypothetical protein